MVKFIAQQIEKHFVNIHIYEAYRAGVDEKLIADGYEKVIVKG